MKINHAILHILDFVSCDHTYANEEMDPSNKKGKNYALKHAGKALKSIDAKRGQFSEGSHFAQELRSYFQGQNDFIALSQEIARFIAGELSHMERPISTDVLVLDFEGDTDSRVRAMTDDEAEAAYQARGKRYFAIMLLESKAAYVHDLGLGETGEANDIAYNRSILPTPAQKVPSWAIIEAGSLSVMFDDKKRTIAGEECWLFPDKLMQCSMEASSKEVFEAVTEIVKAVAEEYGENPTVSVSKAKAYMRDEGALPAIKSDSSVIETGRFDDECPFDEGLIELNVESMATKIFEGNESAQRRFEQAAAARELPERIPLEKKAVERVAKSHKIRTDTGIEITFPAEYGDNPDFMTFTAEANGTYSISLKNIAHIENR